MLFISKLLIMNNFCRFGFNAVFLYCCNALCVDLILYKLIL